jgi:predicted SAM-dependent methyltransferase
MIVAKSTEVALSFSRLLARFRGPIEIGTPTVKVNLGAGLAVAPGWVNVDGSFNALLANFPSLFHRLAYRLSGANRYYSQQEYLNILGKNRFVFADLAKACPFKNESVDAMFSSHFLEHLRPFEAQNLLKQCFSALKPGGILRIAVPDLVYAISLYPSAKKEMLDRFFFVDDEANEFSRHKYMYDFDILREILEKIGFVDISKKAYHKGDCPDITELDNRPDESLFVECRKPMNRVR